MTLPTDVTAIGFDFGRDSEIAYSGGAAEPFDIQFTFADASTLAQSFSLLLGEHRYVGITSDQNLTSVIISNPGIGLSPYTMVDNVSFGTSVPEPATLSLMLSGLGVLSFASRRRKNTAV